MPSSGPTVVLLLELLVGRRFRLGDQTNQVAMSAPLVLTIGDAATGDARERIVETLVGALVGVLVNLLIAPPVHVHVHVARDSLAATARKLSGLPASSCARALSRPGLALPCRIAAPDLVPTSASTPIHRAPHPW